MTAAELVGDLTQLGALVGEAARQRGPIRRGEEQCEVGVDDGAALRGDPVGEPLIADEAQIVDELLAVQGSPADIGGYYRPDQVKVAVVMRPSETFNEIIDALV